MPPIFLLTCQPPVFTRPKTWTKCESRISKLIPLIFNLDPYSRSSGLIIDKQTTITLKPQILKTWKKLPDKGLLLSNSDDQAGTIYWIVRVEKEQQLSLFYGDAATHWEWIASIKGLFMRSGPITPDFQALKLLIPSAPRALRRLQK